MWLKLMLLLQSFSSSTWLIKYCQPKVQVCSLVPRFAHLCPSLDSGAGPYGVLLQGPLTGWLLVGFGGSEGGQNERGKGFSPLFSPLLIPWPLRRWAQCLPGGPSSKALFSVGPGRPTSFHYPFSVGPAAASLLLMYSLHIACTPAIALS